MKQAEGLRMHLGFGKWRISREGMDILGLGLAWYGRNGVFLKIFAGKGLNICISLVKSIRAL